MADDVQLEVCGSIFDIDPQQWDACAGEVPQLRHGFFRALELSGVLSLDFGVLPRYALLKDSTGDLVACAPFMLKWSNRREFGQEIVWLNAGLEAGCFEWPKLQACTPFFSNVAPKLLVRPGLPAIALKAELLQAVYHLGASSGVSALNLMHLSPGEAEECVAHNALISRELNSVWHNPGVETFDEYLLQLRRDKRNKARRERGRAASLGLRFDVIRGADVTEELLADFHRGFQAVCARHGNRPWIPVETFRQLCAQIPESVLLMTAHDGDRFCAGGFCLVGGGKLYADAWSSVDPPPMSLMVEMVCYRPIEYVIVNGLRAVDSGVSAEHKTHRGYTIEPAFNAHWFYNEELAALARGVMSRVQGCSE